ncbi:hypothetical protein CALCODRAFT_496782 [Calocera cornea HHB12733]|uniref:Uncharacterized protein n=1 Tax=Calocera cornea HHB12733 TaxID=1353952 RepID=A0A165FMF1_9BASI|nr:hypothetical protein CALCODRAFT_496782 [Calocera cornea HHB12733]
MAPPPPAFQPHHMSRPPLLRARPSDAPDGHPAQITADFALFLPQLYALSLPRGSQAPVRPPPPHRLALGPSGTCSCRSQPAHLMGPLVRVLFPLSSLKAITDSIASPALGHYFSHGSDRVTPRVLSHAASDPLPGSAGTMLGLRSILTTFCLWPTIQTGATAEFLVDSEHVLPSTCPAVPVYNTITSHHLRTHTRNPTLLLRGTGGPTVTAQQQLCHSLQRICSGSPLPLYKVLQLSRGKVATRSEPRRWLASVCSVNKTSNGGTSGIIALSILGTSASRQNAFPFQTARRSLHKPFSPRFAPT